MPRRDTIKSKPNNWTLLTDEDVTNVSFNNQSHTSVYLIATENDQEPINKNGAILFNHDSGLINVALADIFLSVANSVRLWAFAENPTMNGEVVISYA